jgi:ATP-binding cassette, subfamily B, bacterial MsbA
MQTEPGLTLLFVGLFVIIATTLKVGICLSRRFQAVYIRNGVVKDMREQIYSKMLKLALPFFSEERKGDIITHNRRCNRS